LLLAGLVLVALTACAPPPRPGRVYVVHGPPAARVEVIGRSPGREYVWLPGRWRWTSAQYVWEPGRYVVRERGFTRWVPGHWQHNRRGWYFVDGHWRR
jgi:hypothetical protein